MDPIRPSSLPLLLLLLVIPIAESTGVFRVYEKFSSRRQALADIKARDTYRHARLLSDVDLPIGGIGLPTHTGKYFAEIGIGNPPKQFHVQVDTGSDTLWVRCAGCSGCPNETTIKDVQLQNYDMKASSTGKVVRCDTSFCQALPQLPKSQTLSCILGFQQCPFYIPYGDGSTTNGYAVTDTVHYNQISGDNQSTPAGAEISFGCAAQVSGDLVSSAEALDGIIGFGQSNSSMISQLASSGKARKVFSHCLDSKNGGGIFAIGQVVEPKVKMTPLVPNQTHYNVNLKGIEVGGTLLQLPTDMFGTSDTKGTIIDSGTTLAFLPDVAYNQILNKILSAQSSVSVTQNKEFSCFKYSGSVDDGFPSVTFQFENSLSLVVYPHDYLFETEDNTWCIGWQSNGNKTKDGGYRILLGDIVLSNKLVLYDLENQAIGWTDYNCSSSIKVQDDKTGSVYTVDAHNINSSASIVEMGRSIMLLLLTTMICYFIY